MVITISVKEFKTSSCKWKCEHGNLEKRDIPTWSLWEKETSQLPQMQMSWTNHNVFHLWYPILLSCCGTKVAVNIAYHTVRKCNQLNVVATKTQREEKFGREGWQLRAVMYLALLGAGSSPEKSPCLRVPAPSAGKKSGKKSGSALLWN